MVASVNSFKKAQAENYWAIGITVAATVLLGVLPGIGFDITREAALIGAQFVAGG